MARIEIKCMECGDDMPPKPKFASNWIYCSGDCKQAARKEKFGHKFKSYRYKHYGIIDHTTGEYATEETYERFLKQQNFHCALCEETEDLCMDHDHITMFARGLLCHTHNRALGYLGDCKAGLEAALRYLHSSSSER